jgi:hypothetical protein
LRYNVKLIRKSIMPVTVGFWLSPALFADVDDDLDCVLWRSFIDEVLRFYRNNDDTHMLLTFSAGKLHESLVFLDVMGSPLLLEGRDFQSFSMVETNGGFGYVRDLADIAEEFFAERVVRWSCVNNGPVVGHIAGPGPKTTEVRIRHLEAMGWIPCTK